MTSCPGGLLTFNVEDVIGLVYSINLARGADSEGYGSYISTQYVSPRLSCQAHGTLNASLKTRLYASGQTNVKRSLTVWQLFDEG